MPGLRLLRQALWPGLDSLGLNGGNHHGIDDVLHGATPAQIIHGLFESLQNGANGNFTGFPLGRLCRYCCRC
jgi:hypothetical protein